MYMWYIIFFSISKEKADHIVQRGQHTIDLTGLRCLLDLHAHSQRARIGPGVANGHRIVAYALHIFSQCLWLYLHARSVYRMHAIVLTL